MFINQIFEGLRNTCKVCGQTPCNCTHVAESADPQSRKLGRIIGRIYNEIYDMGDDALDYLNDRAPVWAELWDRYEGDIDSIIAEEDPVTLGRAALELKDILNDLQSDSGVAEGFTKTPSGDYINMHTGVRSSTAPKQKPVRGYKWEVNFDYGPHQSTSVSVTASSENEACAKAEKLAAKNGYRSIMINWAKPADQGVAEEKVRLDPKCWKGKKIGNPKTKMKGGVRVNNCVPAESVEEGWKEKLGAAALTGAMALGAAGAHARVTGDEDPSVNRLTGKPNVTQQATDTAPTSVEAPKGFSKEYLQKAADPNRVGRYLISVEKAQELLSNMKEGAEHNPKDHEADYDKEYQDTVKRAGHAVKNIEKKFGPVDIASLAKRLNDIEQGKK